MNSYHIDNEDCWDKHLAEGLKMKSKPWNYFEEMNWQERKACDWTHLFSELSLIGHCGFTITDNVI